MLLISLVVVAVSALIYWGLSSPKQDIPAAGKRIVVTGAASGVGKETVKILLEKGCFVYACDVNKEGLEDFKNEKNVKIVPVNIRDSKSVEEVAKAVEADGGDLYGLVNCAGIVDIVGMGTGIVEVAEDQMMRVFDINMCGTARMVKAMFPFLHKSKGAIVNIASISGIYPMEFLGYYPASKYAVVGYTDCLRKELRHLGIRVVCVIPGGIATPMTKINPVYAQEGSPFAKLARLKPELNPNEKNLPLQPPSNVARVCVSGLFSSKAPAHMLADYLPVRMIFKILPLVPAWLQDKVPI